MQKHLTMRTPKVMKRNRTCNATKVYSQGWFREYQDDTMARGHVDTLSSHYHCDAYISLQLSCLLECLQL